MLFLYKQTNFDMEQYRNNTLSHINFVSIGGSFQDNIIRSDLIEFNSSYKYDRSLLTTAIPDVSK